MFFGPSAFQLRNKIDKKASPDRSKIKQKFGQHLDPISDASWRPTWLPRPPKTLSKSIKNRWKMDLEIKHIFWAQLGANLEPSWSNFWATWSQLGPTWSQLGPNLGPTWPQNPQDARVGRPIFRSKMRSNFSGIPETPPRASWTPQELIFDDFWPIFDWFLVDLSSMLFVFWSDVDGFSVEFLFMFGSCVAVLLVFWFAGLLLCWFADSPNFHKRTHQLT